MFSHHIELLEGHLGLQTFWEMVVMVQVLEVLVQVVGLVEVKSR
jgi:hypothetical protein